MFRWFALIRLWFIKALEYRAELVMWLLITLFQTSITLLIWLSIFRGSTTIRGFELSQIIQYYLCATLIHGITASHFENWRVREVREGKIDYYLTKPIPYPLQVLCADIGNRLFYICIIVPTLIGMYIASIYLFQMQPITLTLTSGLTFGLLLLIGYLVEFSVAMITVLLGFWLEGAEGLEHFKWIVITLLSGYMIPLVFMPTWLQTVVLTLPLKYLYAVPIQVIQQQYALQLSDYYVLGGFLGGLFFIQWWLWRAAVKKYSSAGG